MNVTQLSVFLENKPGHLENILKILADNKINIRTLTIAEVSDFGIARMIVNKPFEAKESLKNAQVTCSLTDVLAIEIPDKPGSLLDAVDHYRKNNLNIEYMYAFPERREGNAVMIFRFEDIERAKRVIADSGYKVLSNKDITGD
jgi:hypothetical protein